MPILLKLVAICDTDDCGKRQEYEATVRHDGSPERELLRANEVEHEVELPEGWSENRRAFSNPILCDTCTKELYERAVRNGMPRSGRKA